VDPAAAGQDGTPHECASGLPGDGAGCPASQR
jgi:hypothetical protein